MGLCQSENLEPGPQGELNKKKSKELDNELIKQNQDEKKVNKLLLLGAGGSGKSTLFKQMIDLYGVGFPENDRMNYEPIVYQNILQSIKVLIDESPTYGPVAKEIEEDAKTVSGLDDEQKIDKEVGNLIKKVWEDKGIQETYNQRHRFNKGIELRESAKYFFSNLDRVMTRPYIPSKEDVLRARIPTTGIVEQTFSMEGNVFKMFDVGGQRSERKKWIHCFESVTAILFIAAISAYDQVLYEDETTNRMDESLELFDEISNSEWFDNTSIILFLNKKDIFYEKIKIVPLKDHFPEFQGEENNTEQAEAYIQEMFETRNQSDHVIYTHITCATDRDNVKKVFIAVKDIVIRAGLARAGLA